MKNNLFIILLLTSFCYSQDQTDIGTPANSTLNFGGDIQGMIHNSINEATGKVTFSAPLATISANSVSYGISLTYNGQASFKNGQQTNKYNPTSIVGVGWSMGTPKIVVDNKSTGTRDDDDFYLIDGATNSRLVCINRGTTINGSQWEFQLEKYAPWKIYFYHHTGWGDYWKVIKEDGLSYYFGNSTTKDGKDFEVRYDNWIGSSKQLGATSEQTIVWNLTKMEDQWFNNLTFSYDKVNQLMSGKDQTEASYLSRVSSSNGASIQLLYGTKNLNEYYEPHKEAAEPDAYQERYEKRFLQKVSSFNNANQLVSVFNIGYTMNGIGLNTKRYLTSITQTAYKNSVSEILPSQTFEYFLSGIFQGGIKKIKFQTGGSTSFNYINKLLFNNASNQYATTSMPTPSGYQYHSIHVEDNYGLYVYRSQNPISGDKYRFMFYRVWWNGEKWEWNEFVFPHLVQDPDYLNQGGALKDFYAVFEQDFYGFVYDKGTTADIYLFHLQNDGKTWHNYSTTNRNIGSENPSFVSGDGFAALQNHRGGELYTYVWNGTYWNYKLLNQGTGQYYISAKNNFIISLNEDGGADMLNGVVSMDNYYFHYLDAEKNWQTKSWTAAADPYIAQISEGSYWYPDNSIIGFVADSNPELFFRWDTNYNLTNVDNVLGGYYDSSPMVPVGNNMFTIHSSDTKHPYKSASFNGISWSISSLPSSNSYSARLHFGKDIYLFQQHPMYNNGVGYHFYDPNTNYWTYNLLSNYASYMGSSKIASMNNEFITAGDKIYTRTSLGSFNQIAATQYENFFTYTDGLDHSYVREVETSNFGSGTGFSFKKGSFYYMDKKTGALGNVNLGLKDYYANRGTKMGGYWMFMSPKTIWLRSESPLLVNYFYRVIEDQVENSIFDVVVNHIDINDDNGSLRKIQYTYNKPKSTPDNGSTIYEEVIIENKGLGTGNIGKIVKVFNNGAIDLSMAGLPQEVLYIDANNKAVKRISTTWNKYSKSAYNGSTYFYNSFYIRPTIEKEELFFENSSKIINTTTTGYNPLGLKTYSTTIDSKGKTERQDISYAYQTYAFLNDKNMLSFPYQVTTKINNQIVNVEQSKWISDNGKVYINENWSGPSTSALRLNSQISKVLSNGTVVEANNGKGIYNTTIYGYNHLYEVAAIKNATFQEMNDALTVTYGSLQTLSTSNLKTELLKLYTSLPNAFINLVFYDSEGRVVSRINERKEETFIFYDTLGREDYITDAQGKILEKKNYHFNN